MHNRMSNRKFLYLNLTSIFVTLALTPWANVDSLIIPKIILLFASASYLLPYVVTEFKFYLSKSKTKVLLTIIILFILQMLIVMIVSPAPLEQQIFGRSGRGLGFITEISLLIIMLAAVKYVSFKQLHYLLFALLFASIGSSAYSISQKNGFDFFQWNTTTNGIIGTLGNPNFQSSLAALTVIPALSYLRHKKTLVKCFSVLMSLILIYTVYICQSTQGYILITLSGCVFLIIYFRYKNLVVFFSLSAAAGITSITAIAGMLNYGPLSNFLYKTSVTSRGEFWRTALTTTRKHPIFGVGIDSFGDVSSMYKSARDAAGVNEFTDNAHNYFLHYSSTGGLPLLILYTALILLTFLSFFQIQRNLGRFDFRLASIFTFFVGFQAQSIISPGTISLMIWNSLICGSIIGLSVSGIEDIQFKPAQSNSLIKGAGCLTLIISLLVTYPLYNSDRLQLKSLQTKDALLAVKAAKLYPESSLRYSRIGVELLKSGLLEQALEVGRSAVKFNPNSIQAWALVLANTSAPIEERKQARQEILRLDPFNTEIQNIVL